MLAPKASASKGHDANDVMNSRGFLDICRGGRGVVASLGFESAFSAVYYPPFLNTFTKYFQRLS
jgi:cytochrome c oxidase assembly factor CtaG